jgi:hypothetical protein
MGLTLAAKTGARGKAWAHFWSCWLYGRIRRPEPQDMKVAGLKAGQGTELGGVEKKVGS